MIAVIGSISLVTFFVSILYLIYLFFKKKPKKVVFFLLVGSVIVFIISVILTPNPSDNAESWVNLHVGKDINLINEDFDSLEDEDMKQQINTLEANSKTSMFGKKVTAKGKVVEFSEGFDNEKTKPFIIETNDGLKVRVSQKSLNDAVDVGETVSVKGELASTVNKEVFIKNSYVYIE